MKPYLLLVLTDRSLQKCGPYGTAEDRRHAAQEMKGDPRYLLVIEVDAHNRDFYAHVTPSDPEQFR